MPTVDNPIIYQRAKEIADTKYSKPSAYKSGFIVRLYKSMGGTYSGKKSKALTNDIKKIGKGTSTEVRSPTKTSTSTKAKTTGNITVTGGAGDGDTTVVIRRKNYR